MKPLILIVDDEKSSREGLRSALEEHYEVYLAEDVKSAFDILSSEKCNVILSDLRMPGEDGLKLIQKAKTMVPPPICILMTAYGSEELAVEAMKQGADDYISKGRLQLDELEIRIARLLKSQVLETENIQLHQQLDERYGLHTFIGESPSFREILEAIKQVAPSRATVLIEGESGTGKELVAHAIHNLSPRTKNPYIAVHCAALSANLLESELFGHEKGSFTGAMERRQGRFELAHGGTLFLDEIGEIDSSIQVKILRALETQSFERVGGNKSIQTDVRLVAATNRDLKKMVAEGKFREDLFFRLNVINLHMPPLRERKEDIPLLLNHFLKEFSRENNRRFRNPTAEVLQPFFDYPWPGNIRELRNVVQRMVVMGKGDQLKLTDIPSEIRNIQLLSPDIGKIPPTSLKLEEMERHLIRKAITQTHGNISRAAILLGISRRTLHRKLHDLELQKKLTSDGTILDTKNTI